MPDTMPDTMPDLRKVRSDAEASEMSYTLLGRDYTLLSVIRLLVCIFGYLVLRRVLRVYIHNFHVRYFEGEANSDVAEVTEDKDKPVHPDYESEDEGWGSKARKRQREAIKRAEMEAERRNLEEEEEEEESEGIDKYLD